MEDKVVHILYGFPYDKVLFQVRTLYKGVECLFQVSMQDEAPPTIKEFVAPDCEALNNGTFEFRGSNILFFDDDKKEYVDELRTNRDVFWSGCEPIQVKVKSVNAGKAEIVVSLIVKNALIIRQRLSFSVIDIDKELEEVKRTTNGK